MKVDQATGLPVVGLGPSQELIDDMQMRIKAQMPIRAISPVPGNVAMIIDGETIHDLYAARTIQGMLANPELVQLFMEQDDEGNAKFNVLALIEKVFEITAAAVSYREGYFSMMKSVYMMKEAQKKVTIR